ncbi:MAG: UDP-3-O-acylglucosamine N-acyltransferase [Pseudohongiella sp.]|nr:MAG: UDP-3-O-acylglucosamine N-acyltransferase [Pseudohongiella sp.]
MLDVKLIGDGQCEITGLATLQNAKSGDLSFLSNPSYATQLEQSQASAILIEEKFLDGCPGNKLVTANPYVAFAMATHLFDNTPKPVDGVHASASVDSSAVVGKNVSIAANAVVSADVKLGDDVVIGAGCFVGEGAILGDGCVLHSNVTLYHRVVLGKNVVIHSGSIIGADGFGFAFDGSKSVKIHQLGAVNIGDDVEIGACSSIDRGALEDTEIANGVKIDNQVQIGHNCKIGEHTVICGCTGIAGSVNIGKYCIMGGGSGAVGHISIADKVQVSAMTLVSQSILEAGMYSAGTIQAKTSEWKRNAIRFGQLDSISKRLKEIEKSTDKK